jgi:hypothetical protein
MRNVLHNVLTVIAFLFIPIVWISLCIVFKPEPISRILNDWNDHRKSGDAWGIFDA